jgi:DNA-directed RNA polymerase specialized sigma24 family protein
MSRSLKARLRPEEILQESLLHAWRDRRQAEWRGLRAFRSWLLSIIDNRIRVVAVRESA